jgi:hypothetical protein
MELGVLYNYAFGLQFKATMGCTYESKWGYESSCSTTSFFFCLSVRALAKNGSFGFLSGGSCVRKNQMCHLRVGFLH